MKMQPYVIWTTSRLSALKTEVSRDLKRWGSAWFRESLAISVEAMPLTQAPKHPKRHGTEKIGDHHGDQWAVISLDAGAKERIGPLLLGGDQGEVPIAGSMAHDVVPHAFQNLVQHLLQSENPPHVAIAQEGRWAEILPIDVFKPGRGALKLLIHLNPDVSFSVILPIAALKHSVGSPMQVLEEKAPLASPQEALSSQRVTASVILTRAELTIHALANLRVGDVIRLEKTLQDPLELVVNESEMRLRGYLGQKEGNLAFKVDHLENH